MCSLRSTPGTYKRHRDRPRGFKTLTQDKVVVDALQVVGLNMVLQIGTVAETVTVTTAPPALDTGNATLGNTVENQEYTALPLQMNGGARNATQFEYLEPGVSQGNSGSSGVFNGTGSVGRIDELYIDGVPLTRVSLQGDPRNVASASISVGAVDQFQVVTGGSYRLPGRGHDQLCNQVRNKFDSRLALRVLPQHGAGYVGLVGACCDQIRWWDIPPSRSNVRMNSGRGWAARSGRTKYSSSSTMTASATPRFQIPLRRPYPLWPSAAATSGTTLPPPASISTILQPPSAPTENAHGPSSPTTELPTSSTVLRLSAAIAQAASGYASAYKFRSQPKLPRFRGRQFLLLERGSEARRGSDQQTARLRCLLRQQEFSVWFFHLHSRPPASFRRRPDCDSLH